MKVFVIALAALCSCSWAASTVSSDLKVLSVEREIDLETQIVREKLSIELENGGSAQISEYIHTVEASHAKHLAYIEAFAGDGESKKPLKLDKTQIPNKEHAFYAVKFADPLSQGKKVKIQIHCSYIHLLSPFPSHITQAEQQFVVYEGSATVVSAYPIKTQKTKFQLPKGTVENYSKGTELKPVTQDGQAITYGTYDNTESFTVKPVRIHFQNDSPFLSVTHMTRLIELSQWGNIAVEESYEIVHAGARLKGSFSRYDFQRDHRPNMPAVKSYHTILPAAARDVYYRDEIGNISTSHLLVRDDAVDLEIRPRFPLFGGWKTEYYIGYNIPSYEYLFAKGNRYQLNIRFIDHIFDDFIVDELTVEYRK